ncbi:neprilysin-21-like isoform X2 [Sipha flava]|uniref:Neprilysin-21-like isoform X2 n=1 Tax=Sipha flava TaxID=143950 RepID=A0A8B8G8H7_9HEMI|nr:neprilysin-21-like isoform X2 [Sipha flava]
MKNTAKEKEFHRLQFLKMENIEEKITVCNTRSCVQSSLVLMNCINETIDPCEDFYEFACGMFETNYPTYPNTDENSWTSIISLKVNSIVKKFLNQPNEDYEPVAIHKTRMFYETCLQHIDRDFTKYDLLRDVWKKINLDINYLNDSVPLDIETVLAKIQKHLNMNIFFDLDVDDDPRNSSSYSLLIISKNEESIDFHKRMNKETNNVIDNEDAHIFSDTFKSLVDELLNRDQKYSTKISIKDLINTTKELADFENEFKKIIANMNLSPYQIPKIITLGELQNFTDSAGESLKFNWTLYLRELFHDTEPKVYEQLMSKNHNDYEILIMDEKYLETVFTLLSQTQTIIIKMSILTYVIGILEKRFPEYPDSESCFSLTTEFFGMVTGYSMIHTLDNSSKAALIEMNDNIQWAMRKIINEASWLDDESKIATLRKLATTKTYLGYPDDYPNILNNLYQNLNITDNHLENLISISNFNAKNKWNSLVNKRDWKNIEWGMAPNEVNAYNDNSMNAIFIPAASLQAPFYFNGIQSLNYGSVGSTIGHELSHSYDDTGRLYNELGNVVPWWTNKSHEEYTKRTRCLVDRYNDVKIVNNRNNTIVFNGNVTLDENIADITGLKEAYFAYQRFLDIHGQEPRLPGLEQYNQEQIFFLGYANQYCHYDMVGWQAGRHSPNEVRVRVVVSLFPEFAKAWSCPLGSPMNPNKERCQIW